MWPLLPPAPQCHVISRMVANVLTDLMQVLMIFIRLDAMAQLLGYEAAPVTKADRFRISHEVIVATPALAHSSLIPSYTDIAFTLLTLEFADSNFSALGALAKMAVLDWQTQVLKDAVLGSFRT